MSRFFCLFFVFFLNNAFAEDIEITLLGTGSPIPDIERFGPATVVKAGEKYFVFDTGRGVTIRLKQAGIPLNKIENVFLTHLHSDHISGLSDLWLTSWIWKRKNNLKVYGPVGTKNLTQHIQEAYKADIGYRIKSAGLHTDTVNIDTVETIQDGVIYEKDGVRVTAFKVDHGVVKPAYGYRLDYNGRSVVISGDTSYTKNLVKHAQNADVIVHEIAVADKKLLKRFPALQRIIAYHTSIDDMIKVLRETKPRLAVLTHILLYNVSETQALDELRLGYTSKGYTSKLQMGKDLMRIRIGNKIHIE